MRSEGERVGAISILYFFLMRFMQMVVSQTPTLYVEQLKKRKALTDDRAEHHQRYIPWYPLVSVLACGFRPS